MRKKFLLFGLGTWIPGLYKRICKPTGGSCSSRYCYTVWLRHLVRIHEAGFNRNFNHVVEFGPGDSLGIGFAALISGSKSYTALDAHPYRNMDPEIDIFDDIVELFRRREPIPSEKEYPRMRPVINTYNFPKYIFDDEILSAALSPDRINKLRSQLLGPKHNSPIKYIAPWSMQDLESVSRSDLIISQAVFEYVENISELYKTVRQMLSEEGIMSATIDYSAHHLSRTSWNDHWKYSRFIWWILKGNQPYFLNRKTHGDHVREMINNRLAIVLSERTYRPSSIKRADLASELKYMDDEDLSTSGGYFITKAL